MAKTRRKDKPFSVQKMFFQKMRPWRKTESGSNGALNMIIRRLKCSRGSQLFNKEATINKKLVRSNSAPSFPFLSRTLEQGFNSWPSFEQKCREYAEKREQTKSSEIDQPIVEFPPDEENVAPSDSKSADEPAASNIKLTRWQNTLELMPSPITSSKRFDNNSFETVQSLSPIRSRRRPKGVEHPDPLSATLHIFDNLDDTSLQSTPAFMQQLKMKRRRLHSTPKNAFSVD